MFKLREKQSRLVSDVRKKVKEGYEKILIGSPTGSGKTVIFTHIMREMVSRGKRVWAIVHRQELVEQTKKHFPNKKVFVLTADVSEIYSPITGTYRVTDGYTFLDEADICLAMVYTAHSRQYEELKDFNALIIDEAHRRDFDKVLEWWYDLRNGQPSIALGFTATPHRLTRKFPLKYVYQTYVEGAKVSELLEDLTLTPATYFSFEGASDEGLKKSNLDYTANSFLEASIKQRFDASAAILLFHKKITEQGLWSREKGWTKMIMFCASVAQAEREMEILNEKFGQNSKFCDLIHGDIPNEKRAEILESHKNGDFPLLININVLTEGYDDKEVLTVILNRKTKSLSLYVQMVGRGLRVIEGKTHAFVIDLWRNHVEHGQYGAKNEDDLPWEEMFWADPKEKSLQPAPTKECNDDKHGIGCGSINHASATSCSLCEKEFEVKAKKEEVLTDNLVQITPQEKNRADKRMVALLSSDEISPNLMKIINEHYEKGWSFNKLLQTVGHSKSLGLRSFMEIGKALDYKAKWPFYQKNRFKNS